MLQKLGTFEIPKPIAQIELYRITVDKRLMTRAKPDTDAIKAYSQAYENGVELPPLKVFKDGLQYWLVAGFMRIEAAEKIKIASLPCEVYEGGFDDALLYAYRNENVKHGVRLRKADRLHKINSALAQPELRALSVYDLAKMLQVSEEEIEKCLVEYGQGSNDENDRRELTLPESPPVNEKLTDTYFPISENISLCTQLPGGYTPNVVVNFVYSVDDLKAVQCLKQITIIMDSSVLIDVIRKKTAPDTTLRIFWFQYAIGVLFQGFEEITVEDTKIRTLDDCLRILVSNLTEWKDNVLVINPETSLDKQTIDRNYLGWTQDQNYIQHELNKVKQAS